MPSDLHPQLQEAVCNHKSLTILQLLIPVVYVSCFIAENLSNIRPPDPTHSELSVANGLITDKTSSTAGLSVENIIKYGFMLEINNLDFGCCCLMWSRIMRKTENAPFKVKVCANFPDLGVFYEYILFFCFLFVKQILNSY